jgi:hypothetical protein
MTRVLGRRGGWMAWGLTLASLTLVAGPALLRADEGAAAEAEEKKIRDNLFLLEEAYNQDPGVIQHIQTYQRGNGSWAYVFTDEWPVPGERHQLSLTVPVLSGAPAAGAHVGDVLLNYRLQAFNKDGRACAPRLSLVLPTGDAEQGSGQGGLGIQTSLPVSLELHPHWVLHLNAGFTYVPRALDAVQDERWGALDTTVGAALVWLPVYRVNGVLEALHQSSKAGPLASREGTVTLNPGIRMAFDFKSGLQIVPGFSVPIEFSGGTHHTSVLLYLSFEHTAWK